MPNERQVPVPIEEEMRKSYLDYAMSVIVGRALPDIRDGLKPVHRRVLYTMQGLGLNWNRAYKKAARVIGDCMGKYHPHGDAPIYEALVRMVQEFSLRYPLVDGQGNYGSVDGDPPAAMRYTEARLAKIAHEMLADIDRDTVDFVPNFDESEREPVVLPTRIPNLLVNGSAGIAVGMATNIPPHNLTEVVDALVTLIDTPETTIEQLLKIVKGPDFPTRGYIYGAGGIREAYTTGRGTITLRAKAHAEKMRGGREAIIITELPYQVNKASLIEKIAELSGEKKIEGISEIRDESSREGIRVVLELGRGEIPQIIMNQLQAHPDADDLRDHHAGARRPAAADRQPEADARGVRPLPSRDRDAADALRSGARGGAGPYPRRPPQGRGAPRRGDPPDPPGREPGRREGRPDGPPRPLGDPGEGHPRHAAPAPHPARAPQGRGGARADAGAHRGAEGHPGVRAEAHGDHPERAARAQGGVRRRAAHRDPHRDDRADDRGSPGRRGDGRHDHALRLHQADPRRGVSEPAAWRQRRDGHGDQGGGYRRGPLRRLDPLLPPLLHRAGQGPLAQGPRDPRGRAPGEGEGDGESPVARRGRGGRHVRARARLRGGRLRPLRDQAGQGEEDRAGSVLAPARRRYPGDRPRGRRHGHHGAPHRRPARGDDRDEARHDHPLPRRGGAPDGARRRRRERHRAGGRRRGHQRRRRAGGRRDPDRHRARLRQTDAAGGVPTPGPGGQGDHRHQDGRPQR